MITVFSSLNCNMVFSLGAQLENDLGASPTRLNKVIKTIIFAKKFCHQQYIFKALDVLKIKAIYQLELGKFMCQTFKGNIPHEIDTDSIKLTSVHKHCTRHTSNEFHLPKVNTFHGQKMLSFAGVKLWSELDSDSKSLDGFSLKNT